MTKAQNYDGLEIDEGRMCGGAGILKFVRKTNCLASSGKKDHIPRMTSSSSFTSSQESSVEYDPPSNAQFRMPNQIGELVEEGYKLDFKLHAENHSEFLYHNKTKDNIFLSEEPQNMIRLNPQVINQLKTKHLQSLNGDFSGNCSSFEAFPEDVRKPSTSKPLENEMPSNREELKAVRKSLPNQFEINYFCVDSSDEQENQSPGETVDFNQYFKNDWNLSFHDRDYINKEYANKSDATQTTVSSDISGSVVEPEGNFPDCSEMPFEKEDLSPQEITPANSATPDDKEGESLGISPKSKLELERILNQSGITTTEENRSSSESSSQFEEDMKMVKMLLRKYGNTITDQEEQRRFDKARRLHAIVNPPSDKWFHRHAAGMCLTPEKLSPNLPCEEELSPIQAPPMPSPPVSEKPKATIAKVEHSPSEKAEPQVPVTPKASITKAEQSPAKKAEPQASIVAARPSKSVAAVPQKRIAAVPQKPKSAIVTSAGRSPAKKTVHFKEPAVAQSVTYEVVQKRHGVTALKVTPGLRTSVDDQRQTIDGNTTPTRRSPGRLSSKVKYWEQKKF